MISRLVNSTFVRHNAVFFAGSLLVGFLNYLYYPVLGRMLAPTSFGEVQTLFSLFAQTVIFLNVLGLVVVNIVANYGDTLRGKQILLELEKLAALFSLVILGLAIFGSVFLKDFFRFEAAAPFAILALAIVVTVPLTLRTAYLRGKQVFTVVALVNMLAAAGDLIFSIVLVLGGTRTTGAILGLVIAQAAALLLAARYAHQRGFIEHVRGSLIRLPDMRLILPELKFALLVLTGSLTITAMYSIDTIAIKHYFDAHEAGLYAGIAIIARIIFFLTASIAQVLMPSIKLHNPLAENQRAFLKSLALLIAIGGGVLLVFTVMPGFVIHTLMGNTYLHYADLLPRLSLVLFIVSILNLFVIYHVTLRHYYIIPIVLVGFGLTLGLLSTSHGAPLAVINDLFFGSLAMLALFGGWAGINMLRNKYVFKEVAP